MKYAFCICAVLFACLFSGCLLRDSFDNEKSSYLIDEKSSYLIDSNPRGLRVTIDDIELGTTPCKYEFSNQTPVSSISWVKVYPPTKQQLKTYSEENQKILSLYCTTPQTKTIHSYPPRNGTLFFQFIESEYNIPKTDEEREWVKRALEEDSLELRRTQELREALLEKILSSGK